MAARDFVLTLQPGQRLAQQIEADYIYCKAADRPVWVIVHSQKVQMESGDKFRPTPFGDFEIENPDRGRPLSVVLTIGKGDYNRQIIQGTVSTRVELEAADGTRHPDTRRTLWLEMFPAKTRTLQAFEKNQVIPLDWETPVFTTGEPFGSEGQDIVIFNGPNGKPCLVGEKSSAWIESQVRVAVMNESGRVESYRTAFTDVANGIRGIWYRPDLGTYEFVITTGSTNNYRTIYRFTNDETAAQVVQFQAYNDSSQFNAPGTYDSKAHKWLIGHRDGIVAYNPETGERAQVFEGASNDDRAPLQYDAQKDMVWAGRSASTVQSVKLDYEKETYEVVDEYIPAWSSTDDHDTNRRGFAVEGNKTLLIQASESASLAVRRLVLERFDEKPKVMVTQNRSISTAMYRPGPIPETTAKMGVVQEGQGEKITGEIIRAALEWFYGRAVGDDYMDHIYRADLPSDTGENPRPAIVTGTQSFAAAEITDDFNVMLPGAIRLEVDSRLKLNEAI